MMATERNEPDIAPVLPNNVEAEAGLLGALMIDNRLVDRIADRIAAEDFFEPLHGRIFETILREHGLGRRVNPITLKPFFEDDASMKEVGGASYMAQLTGSGAAVIGASGFADQIRELAQRRILLGRLDEIAGGARDCGRPLPEILAEAESAIAEAGRESLDGSREMSAATAVDLAMKAGEDSQQRGVMSGIETLDALIGSIRRKQLAILAGRPGMGKSALAASYGRGAAHNGHGVLVISLEMSAEELGARIASDETFDGHGEPVPYELIENGMKRREDIRRVYDAKDRIEKLPLEIVDIGQATTGRVNALTRRWKRRMKARGGSLELVVIDYLQKLRPNHKTRDRIEAVTEISQDLKTLAKENDVGVLALSQLSRAVEARADHRPQLSDLRECLPASAMLTDADTGALVSISEVVAGQRVLSMDEQTQMIVRAVVADRWSNGVKPIFRLSLASGRQVEATANHPFFTEYGWRALSDIAVGTDVALSAVTPGMRRGGMKRDLCRLAGYMAGDGTCKKHREVGFIANVSDAASLADFKALIGEYFPDCLIRSKPRFNAEQLSIVCLKENGYGRPFGNPFRQWLRRIGMHDQGCFTKIVPPAAFLSGFYGAAAFITGYLQTDGTVKKVAGKTWRVSFSSVSRELLVGAQELLARLGVPAAIGGPEFKGRSAALWNLRVSSKTDALKVLSKALGQGLRKLDLLAEICGRPPLRTTGPGAYALPRVVSALIARRSREAKLHWTETWRDQGKRMRRETALAWADRLGDCEIHKWASSDLLWDEVVAIEPAGEAEVFDVRVEGTHSFVANGIVAHNSGQIEQDADLVLFLFRAEYYLEQIEPREDAGEERAKWDRAMEACRGQIEFICAKRRQGRTGKAIGRFHGAFAAVRG